MWGKRGKSGVTLLELLVVVIIIGILATIAVPRFTGLIKKAKGAEARTILGAIRTAQQIYNLENDEWDASVVESDIEDRLGVEIDDNETYYDYAVNAAGTYNIGTTTYSDFTATAINEDTDEDDTYHIHAKGKIRKGAHAANDDHSL